MERQAHVCLRSVSSIDVTIIVPAPAAELDLVERETISRQAPEEVKYLLEVIFYYSVQDGYKVPSYAAVS